MIRKLSFRAKTVYTLCLFLVCNIIAAWVLHPYWFPTAYNIASLSIGQHIIVVEIADTYIKRQRGLMYRHSLADDSGMLFVYPSDRQHRFWMKNTSLLLDVAFISQECRILQISHMLPNSTDRTISRAPARFALEMNQGWFDENQIYPGDTIRLLKPSAISENTPCMQ